MSTYKVTIHSKDRFTAGSIKASSLQSAIQKARKMVRYGDMAVYDVTTERESVYPPLSKVLKSL